METARAIVENRTNALGVSENVIQVAGDRRIVGEFPGAEDSDAILDIIQQTGLLEFVDTGDYRPEEGTILQTDFHGFIFSLSHPADGEEPQTVYHTIMTGKELRSVNVRIDQLGQPGIDFILSPEGTAIFAQHTAANVGRILAITLDKRVVSAPSIQGAIPDGQGQITGSFTLNLRMHWPSSCAMVRCPFRSSCRDPHHRPDARRRFASEKPGGRRDRYDHRHAVHGHLLSPARSHGNVSILLYAAILLLRSSNSWA
jgi:hypothetical protein